MSRLIESPLSLELVFPRGSRKHDYSDLPCPVVARQLAEAHLSLTNTGGGIKSVATSAGYAKAVRALAIFLGSRSHRGGLDRLDERTLLDFYSASPRKSADTARLLLLRCEEEQPGLLDAGVLAHISTATRRGQRSERLGEPVPPLSPTEAEALEEACKHEIRALEQRLAEGAVKADQGSDPRLVGASDEALLWLLRAEGPSSSTDLALRCGYSHRNSLSNRSNRASRSPLNELHRMLFPTADDLLPYLLLLGLTTGISPEGLASLTVDSFREIGEGKIRLSWFKARGGGKEADTFRDRGPWSPGGLLQAVAVATARSRKFADGEDVDSLWLAWSPQHAISTVENGAWHRAIGSFVARNGLVATDGVPLSLDRRRLRKTFYARLDKRYHGAVNLIAGVNQSAQVAGDHYLASGETETVMRTVEEAQLQLVRRAEATKVTVISDQELPDLEGDLARAADRLGVAADKAKRLLSGESEDVFAAKCLDFHNSPLGQPGEPCPAAVWECLSCPLAVITPSKLPNLLSLLDHIDKAFDRLPTAEWQARYATPRRSITEQILPRFSDTVIAAARAKALESQLYLPPEEAQA